jgi:predicted permease
MTMNIFFKASALAIYLLAVASAFVTLPLAYTSALQNGAAILLGLHVLELLIFFKFVRRYPGQLVDSMALTLLFGFLHWLPLAKGTRT